MSSQLFVHESWMLNQNGVQIQPVVVKYLIVNIKT